MLWVLKRTVSLRRFFWAPKTYVNTDGKENIYNFTLKYFVYLTLCNLLPSKFHDSWKACAKNYPGLSSEV